MNSIIEGVNLEMKDKYINSRVSVRVVSAAPTSRQRRAGGCESRSGSHIYMCDGCTDRYLSSDWLVGWLLGNKTMARRVSSLRFSD